MTTTRKSTLLILGALSALFLASQLVLGQLILSGRADLKKAHQHTGYTAVALAMAYLGLSLATIAAIPARAARRDSADL